MKIKLPNSGLPKIFSIVVLAIVITASLALGAPSPASSANSDAALKQQVAELQAKVKQLEAALPAKAASPAMPPMNQKVPAAPAMPGMTPSSSDAMSMGEMKMGGMPKDSAGSTPTPGDGMGSMMTGMMGMMNQMMGMNAMPAVSPGMNPSVPQSALPGFPGVSHLYHIGSTGFFLDHAAHISLTSDQQAALNRVKEQAVAAKTGADRQIEQAEQEMATLTAADQPDSAKIEAKVREIEKLRTDERLSFIRAVGEAAKLLTDDQRKILTGAMQTAAPLPSATMSPMPDM
jgi:Spy/CpxP family protein refolding chaperone